MLRLAVAQARAGKRAAGDVSATVTQRKRKLDSLPIIMACLSRNRNALQSRTMAPPTSSRMTTVLHAPKIDHRSQKQHMCGSMGGYSHQQYSSIVLRQTRALTRLAKCARCVPPLHPRVHQRLQHQFRRRRGWRRLTDGNRGSPNRSKNPHNGNRPRRRHRRHR
jgi:hypothetical protein